MTNDSTIRATGPESTAGSSGSSSSGSPRATRRRVLQVAGAGVAGAVIGVGATGTAVAQRPRLHTDGRWIRDTNGEAVKLRGVATAALDFINEDWFPRDPDAILQQATNDEWHTNVIRLPVTEWPVHEQGMDFVIDDLIRPAVDLLADRDVYAMIDFHLIRPYVDAMGNAQGMVGDGWADDISGLGFDANVETHDLLVEFWSAVAPAFADDDHVLYEIFNEPTLPVEWADYGEYGADVTSREDSWLLWRDAAQPWVDLVQAAAPDTPVVIGSPHWTSETQFAPQHPFDGDNLIYASHIYPPNGQPADFDWEYGAPAQEVPVVCTEFGWDPDEPEDSEGHGSNSGWGEPVREWMESYENMGWIAWCFDDSWAPTMFDSPNEGAGSPWTLKDGPEQMGGFVKQWLAETNGQTEPPGGCENGIEVGEYCATDPNGDGKHTDVNGNGGNDFDDVVTFFEEMQSDGVQSNVSAFDFNGNGTIDFDDVVALFETV